MKKTVVYCDKCGKQITDGDTGSLHIHFRRWGGGSIGGIEDEHDCNYSDLCSDCIDKLVGGIYEMGYKFENKR